MSGETDGGAKVGANDGWGANNGVMLGVQAAAYALLVVVGAVWGGFSAAGADVRGIAAVPSVVFAGVVALIVVALVVFHVFWPFRATLIDRAIGLVSGVLSLAFVFTSVLSPYRARHGAAAGHVSTSIYQLASWAAAVAGLLVVVTIVSFARQMLRAERSHLIRALSHCVTGAAASISLVGWFFLPYIAVAGRESFSGSGVRVASFVGVVVVMVLFAAVLAFASTRWLGELDPDPAARRPWIGVALLPFMFYGLVVFAAALFLQLV